MFLTNPFFKPLNSNFCSSGNSTLLPCCSASRLNKRLKALGCLLGQAIATLADSEVNLSVTVQTCQLVFVNELIGDVQDFDANAFGFGHRSIQVEALKVDGAQASTFPRENTVEEELEKLQQCCVCTHISRVADVVATNGDPCAVRVILFRTYFTYDHGMVYFLSLVQWNVMVVNAKESGSTGYMLGARGSPEPMSWQR